MSEKSLKQMLLNACEQERGLAVELAKIAGYSSGSSFMKVLKDEKKEFAKFYGLLKVVRHQFPSKEKELMTDYAHTLDPNKQTARNMLEYLEVSKLNKEKEILSKKLSECDNTISNEWAGIYLIDSEYLKGNISFLDAIKRFEGYKTKSPETRSVLNIFKCYCYSDHHMYDMVHCILLEMENDLKLIKDEYIREVLWDKYYLLLAEHNIRKKNLRHGRELCFEIINNMEEPVYKGWACLHIANSYIITDYNTSSNFLKMGLNYTVGLSSLLEKNLKRSYNFLDNLWNKTPEFLDINSEESSDVHEVVFYYINHKQYNKALEILDKEDLSCIDDNGKAFHYYLKGLITNNIDDFCNSIRYFRKSGDVYFRKLPLLELEKMDVNQSLIMALAE
jgi:hypothetical protein